LYREEEKTKGELKRERNKQGEGERARKDNEE